MSKQPPNKRRPQQRKGRTAAAAKTAKKGTDRTAWIIVAIVIVVGGALVFVFASGANKTAADGHITGRQTASLRIVPIDEPMEVAA